MANAPTPTILGLLATGRTREEVGVYAGTIQAALHRERCRRRGSLTSALSPSKTMAGRVSSRKAGQPGSPSLTKSTQD